MSELLKPPVDKREKIIISKSKVGSTRQERIVEDRAAERRQWISRLINIVELTAISVISLIGFRVLLRAIGANPENLFARFIYAITAPLVGPFIDLVNTPEWQGLALEISSLFAVAVYAFAAWLLIRLLWVLLNRRSTRAVFTYMRDDWRPDSVNQEPTQVHERPHQ